MTSNNELDKVINAIIKVSESELKIIEASIALLNSKDDIESAKVKEQHTKALQDNIIAKEEFKTIIDNFVNENNNDENFDEILDKICNTHNISILSCHENAGNELFRDPGNETHKIDDYNIANTLLQYAQANFKVVITYTEIIKIKSTDEDNYKKLLIETHENAIIKRDKAKEIFKTSVEAYNASFIT